MKPLQSSVTFSTAKRIHPRSGGAADAGTRSARSANGERRAQPVKPPAPRMTRRATSARKKHVALGHPCWNRARACKPGSCSERSPPQREGTAGTTSGEAFLFLRFHEEDAADKDPMSLDAQSIPLKGHSPPNSFPRNSPMVREKEKIKLRFTEKAEKWAPK